MKQINSNGCTWLFYTPPTGATNFYIDFFGFLRFDWGKSLEYPNILPTGEWSIHCDSRTVTDEQAAELVTNEGTAERPCYADYTDPLCGHKSAIQSLLSMAKEEGVQPPFIVLKKQ